MVSRLGRVTARHSCVGRQPKFSDVEQRAPPMFGRAAITLGIGPHSSISLFFCDFNFEPIFAIHKICHALNETELTCSGEKRFSSQRQLLCFFCFRLKFTTVVVVTQPYTTRDNDYN